MQPNEADRPATAAWSPGTLPAPGQPQLPPQPQSPFQPQTPFGSPVPLGPPPPRRTRWPLIVGAVVVLLLVIGGLGTAAWVLTGHKAGSPGSSPAAAGAATWGVGSCIWLAKDFPHPTPSVVDPQLKQMIEQAKEYEPIACTDPRAIAKITALGATAHGTKPIQDSGCPDDTDMAVRTKDKLAPSADSQIYCARNLKAPHPGDPGGGGGGVVVNDCVWVASSGGARVLNDEVEETKCGDGSFAMVLAKTKDKSACPANTLSRIPLGDSAGTVLCLGQGSGSLIAKPGDCLWTPSNTYRPATRDDCGHNGPLSATLVAMADSAAQCPKGTHGRQYSGYDRWLCVRYANGA
jgi:hypothetical protein